MRASCLQPEQHRKEGRDRDKGVVSQKQLCPHLWPHTCHSSPCRAGSGTHCLAWSSGFRTMSGFRSIAVPEAESQGGEGCSSRAFQGECGSSSSISSENFRTCLGTHSGHHLCLLEGSQANSEVKRTLHSYGGDIQRKAIYGLFISQDGQRRHQ